jgi:hypothetical protein
VLSGLEDRASLIIELVLLVGELTYSNSVVSTQTGLWALWVLRKCWSSRSGLLAGDGFGSLRHMSRSLARILKEMRSCLSMVQLRCRSLFHIDLKN